jgi:hypothetical protein
MPRGSSGARLFTVTNRPEAFPMKANDNSTGMILAVYWHRVQGQHVKRTTKIIGGGVCVLLASLVTWTYMLFHGYFDRGNFEIKEVERSSGNQVAILVERWDNEALGGLDYFVLTGNHVFSPDELRHAYHSDAVIFAAESACLKLRWDGPNKLVIRCVGSTLDRDHINAQKQQSGGVIVSYENVSLR